MSFDYEYHVETDEFEDVEDCPQVMEEMDVQAEVCEGGEVFVRYPKDWSQPMIDHVDDRIRTYALNACGDWEDGLYEDSLHY